MIAETKYVLATCTTTTNTITARDDTRRNAAAQPERTMMRAIRIDAHGGPEALRLVALPLPKLGAGMVLIRHAAIGVNFVDTQHRTGAPYAVTLPLIPGTEAAGVVVKVGSNVADIQVGDRVAYAAMHGVYAEYAAVPASVLVPVPDELDLSMAAAALLQGTTAHYLSHCAYPLGSGDHALVHAAAGGVGRLLVQFAKQRGATVIAMVSTEFKAQIARADGADHVVIAPQGEFADVVRGLTGGRGVDVVYDSVGRATFMESLAALRTRGLLVAYGQSSGPVPPFHITSLAGFNRGPQNGSLFVTWPANSDYNATRKQLLWRAATVFNGILAGNLRVEIAGRFSLNEAGSAHRLLESHSATGKLLLIP